MGNWVMRQISSVILLSSFFGGFATYSSELDKCYQCNLTHPTCVLERSNTALDMLGGLRSRDWAVLSRDIKCVPVESPVGRESVTESNDPAGSRSAPTAAATAALPRPTESTNSSISSRANEPTTLSPRGGLISHSTRESKEISRSGSPESGRIIYILLGSVVGLWLLLTVAHRLNRLCLGNRLGPDGRQDMTWV